MQLEKKNNILSVDHHYQILHRAQQYHCVQIVKRLDNWKNIMHEQLSRDLYEFMMDFK